MTNLGILTMTPSESHLYFNEMAKKAHKYNIVLYLFSPLSIDPSTLMIKGYQFDSLENKWKEKNFPIPNYLYDRCFYGEDRKSTEAQAVVSWLKSQPNINFLGYGLPNKWKLYEELKKEPSISPYLPLTKKVANAEQVLAELNMHKEIILKPINGAHGFAVYSFKKIGKSINVRTTKKNRVIEKLFESNDSFDTWLETLLTKQIFIMQPRINNLNKMKEPFDLRILIQKDEEGKWKEIGRAIRCGKQNGILTNLSAGANILPFHKWKEMNSKLNHSYIEQELNDILKHLPAKLEEKFHPLFELGIDIIIANDQSLWILDMNSKPGRKIIQLTEPNTLDTLYSAPLAYCSFLHSQINHAISN